MAELTRKQKRFIEEYVIDMNATRAAKAAGYSPNSAYEIGSQNLRKLEIKQEIDKRLAELTMSAEEATRRLTDWGRGSLEPFMVHDTEHGWVLNMKNTKAKSNLHLLKKVKQTKKVFRFAESGDTETTYTTEIEIIDPQKSVIEIAKIKGLYGSEAADNSKPIVANITITPASVAVTIPPKEDEEA